MLAFEAIQAGDLTRLKTQVVQEPTLVNARGTNGNTLLNLAVSCKQPTIVRILLDAGADVDLANNKGWTPLHQAAYSNQSDMADMLLEAGASVGAGAHREFHRPHSGFPPWNPSDDPQEIIDEAFVYACKNGRVGVLGFLLERGANIAADPYRGTGLLWATWNGHLDSEHRG